MTPSHATRIAGQIAARSTCTLQSIHDTMHRKDELNRKHQLRIFEHGINKQSLRSTLLEQEAREGAGLQ